jgi:hypothetical protein
VVGPAWGPSLPSEPARRPTLATIEEGRVALEPARGVPTSSDTIRVVFVSRQPDKPPKRPLRGAHVAALHKNPLGESVS